MRILCTGDLHIGRRSSRLPASPDAGANSCAAAWRAIVETAIAQRVDLVAVSGDLVDQGNRYFEALAPLEQGLRRLADHDIPTVAVAGNHDHDVLPRLADDMNSSHFHLLGRGGIWERKTLELAAGLLHVDGWSFPSESVTRSPMLDLAPRPAGDGLPVLGLLHADLDQGASRYAPVTRTQLRDAGCTAWLLGHIHAPSWLEDGGTPVLYPGSPQPVDPGESGWHGAWLMHVAPGQRVRAERLPVATVRYDSVRISLDGVTDADEIEPRAYAALGDYLNELLASGEATRWMSCRVRLVGRCGLRAEALRRLEPLTNAAVLEREDSTLYVEHVRSDLRPALDLSDLSRGNDAPALLARLLLDLDANEQDPEHRQLLRELGSGVVEVHGLPAYLALRPLPDEERSTYVRDAARRQALSLLDSLLTTRAGT